MSALLPSPFQVRRSAQLAAEDISHLSHENGYRQGYAVGKHDMVPYIQQALGIGALVGVCIGVVLTFVVMGAIA